MAVSELKIPNFKYYTENEILVLHDGFVVTFYLPGNHFKNKEYVHNAINLFLDLPGLPDTLGVVDEDGYPHLLDNYRLKSIVSERLSSNLPETTLQIIDSETGASYFSIRYYGLDEVKYKNLGWQNIVSGISFSFPTDYLDESGLLEMFNFANELSVLLPFSFGYISPAFIYHDGIGESAAFKMIIRLSKRYHCLDIPALLPDCFEIGESPKGVYWGNYFNAKIVKQLGGEEAIRHHLKAKELRIRFENNGSMSIYLNPFPLAGDQNRVEDLSSYKLLYSLISPLLYERKINYMEFDEENMKKWIYRFESE
jgi:hypothetical protein